MPDIEQRLRALWDDVPEPPASIDLATAATAASSPAGPAAGERRWGRGRRRRGAAVAVVVALAAAVVAAIALVVPSRHETKPPAIGQVSATPSASATVDPVTPPAGMQYVSSHGITLTVPKSWPVGFYPCRDPSTDAVEVDLGLDYYCPITPNELPSSDITLVDLGVSAAPIEQQFGSSSVTVAGLPATRSVVADSYRGNGFVVYLDFGQGHAVSVRAPTAARADAVLATTRATPVDHLGCDARLTDYGTPPNTTATALLPTAPVAMTACEYANPDRQPTTDGWLATSRVVTSPELDDLVSRLRPASGVAPGPTPLGADANRNPVERYLVRLADGTTRVLDLIFAGTKLLLTDGTYVAEVETNNQAWSPPTAINPATS